NGDSRHARAGRHARRSSALHGAARLGLGSLRRDAERRMTPSGRTIMLVDDHAVVREGYRAVLQKQPGLKVVAEAGDGAEAYRLFKATTPDLVIMDLTMPGIGGIEAIRRIRQ